MNEEERRVGVRGEEEGGEKKEKGEEWEERRERRGEKKGERESNGGRTGICRCKIYVCA